jgi:Heterokaryon incompatibility protein (HET)
MRLIDTSTFELKIFSEGQIPPYAILSHTWGDQELSLQELQELGLTVFEDGDIGEHAGARKIRLTCRKALEDGYQYAWVDTCCIDKTSSAELSEAINSMFRWYFHAELCYVYLADVIEISLENHAAEEALEIPSVLPFWPGFEHSRWFTRGWTLRKSESIRFVHVNAANRLKRN